MTTTPPLFLDTMAMTIMLLEFLEQYGERKAHVALRQRLSDGVLRLMDHVVLAISSADRLQHLQAADMELRTLRVHLAIALELEILEESFFQNLSERSDHMGRQIGGWIKKLNPKREKG